MLSGFLKYGTMKFNWGTGIFLTIILFLIGMITLVIISSMQPLNLVSPDYYPKGIDYQNQINRISRAKNLKQPLRITQSGDEIIIQFPAIDSVHKPEGKVLLFFPIDNHLDREVEIETDDSLYQHISKKGLLRSRCIVKVTWTHDTLDYYVEEELMIQ
jgi:hypothetical protein